MGSRWVKYAVLALLSAALVVLSPTAPAYAANVTLSGVITGPSGPVDGGRLRVRAVGGQAVLFTATSNAAGEYSVVLPAGNYDLTYLGPPSSGLLARAPNKAIPVDSTFDANVTSQSISISVVVTAPSPYVQSTTSDGLLSLSQGTSELTSQTFRLGDTKTFTVLPGNQFHFGLLDLQQVPSGVANVNGSTLDVLYEEDTVVDLALPVHPLELHAQTTGGAPLGGKVAYNCEHFGAVPGWFKFQAQADELAVPASGDLTVLVGNSGSATCDIRFQPTSGPFQRVPVAGSSTTQTITVGPGIHLTGTVSDGAGATTSSDNRGIESYGPVDGSGNRYITGRDANDDNNFDLEVEPGQHSIITSMFNIGPFEEMQVETALATYSSSTVVNVAPVRHSVTIQPRTPGGDPVQSTAVLYCRGKPLGQSAVENQQTKDTSSGSTSIVLFGADSTYTGEPPGDACTLDVTPTVGLPVRIAPFHFTNGETKVVTIDPGVTVSGTVVLPGVTSFAPNSLQVLIQDAAGTVAVSGSVAANGTFSVQHAPKGNINVILAGGAPSGWSNVFRQQTVPGVTADVANLDVSPATDDLTVHLLDDSGNPATATLELSCQGRRVGQPANSFQVTAVVRSGTGVVTIPGFARQNGLPCELKTSFASGLVMLKNVVIAVGGSTITQIESGSVTLAGNPQASNDLDGVADSLEAYAPNVGDGDNDGTADYQQPDVASLPENGGGLASSEEYLTVEGPTGKTLELVSTAALPTVPPPGIELPDGVVDVTVDGVTPGSDVEFTVSAGPTTGINAFATFDPATSSWSTLPASDVVIGASKITITVTDNGPFDRNPTPGRVRHPGGGTKLDIEVPVITGEATSEPNDKGWYDGNVTVEWSITDNKDTLTPPPNTVVSAEGDDITATSAERCDLVGNCATGSLAGLKIDKTKPVVNLTGPVNGATYVLGAVPSRTCQGTDPGGSGVPDGGACVVTLSGSPTSVGSVTLTAKATDRAGNTATKTVTYKQVYKTNALSAPAAGSKLKVFQKGSTVVVRVQTLNASGQAVATAKAPTWITPKASGKSKGKVNQPVSSLKPDKGAVLIRRGSFWEFRWGTAKAKSGKAYLLTVRLDDGTTRTVTIGIG